MLNKQKSFLKNTKQGLLIALCLALIAFLTSCGLTSKDTEPSKGNYEKLTVYAATGKGIGFSTDSGNSWLHYKKSKTNGLLDEHINTVFLVDDKTFWVGTEKGVALTTDNAKTWQSFTRENGLGSDSVQDILSIGNTLYAATTSGFSISTDNATSWINLTEKDGLASNHINDILIDENTIYLATNKGLCISTDNATTWQTIPVTGDVVNRVYLHNELYLCTNTGIYAASTNVLELKKITHIYDEHKDLLNRPVFAFYIDNNETWWLGTNNGLARSDNKGQGWKKYDESDGIDAYIVNDIFKKGLMVFAATNRGLAVSNDEGESWVTYNKDEGLQSTALKRIIIK